MNLPKLCKKLISWQWTALGLLVPVLGILLYSVVNILVVIEPAVLDLPLEPRIVSYLSYGSLLLFSLVLLVVGVALWKEFRWGRTLLWGMALFSAGATLVAMGRVGDPSGWWWLMLCLPVYFSLLLYLIRTEEGKCGYGWVAIPLMAVLVQLLVFFYSPLWFADATYVDGVVSYANVAVPVPAERNVWILLQSPEMQQADTETLINDLVNHFGYNYQTLELLRPVTDPEMRRFLDDSRHLVDYFFQVVAVGEMFQCATALVPDEGRSCTYALAGLFPTLTLTHAVALRETDLEQATNYALAVLDYTAMVLVADDYDLSAYPQAIRLYHDALNLLENLLNRSAMDAQLRQVVLAAIAQARPDGTGYQRLVKAIYASDAFLIDRVTASYQSTGFAGRYFWQPNRTKQLLATAAELQIDFVRNGCSEEDRDRVQQYIEAVRIADTWFDLAPNTIGLLLVGDHLGEVTDFGRRECALIERIDGLLDVS